MQTVPPNEPPLGSNFSSPTGLPRLPPAAVPWVTLGCIGAVAVVERWQATGGPQWLDIIQFGLVAVCGAVSPGWRKKPTEPPTGPPPAN